MKQWFSVPHVISWMDSFVLFSKEFLHSFWQYFSNWNLFSSEFGWFYFKRKPPKFTHAEINGVKTSRKWSQKRRHHMRDLPQIERQWFAQRSNKNQPKKSSDAPRSSRSFFTRLHGILKSVPNQTTKHSNSATRLLNFALCIKTVFALYSLQETCIWLLNGNVNIGSASLVNQVVWLGVEIRFETASGGGKNSRKVIVVVKLLRTEIELRVDRG